MRPTLPTFISSVDLQRLLDGVDARRAVRLRRDQPDARRLRSASTCAAACARPEASSTPGAGADRARVHLLGQRVSRPRRPPGARRREADHHHEAVVAQDEVARAVDRIDHPDARSAQARAGRRASPRTGRRRRGTPSRRRATISALAAWSASVTGSSPALLSTSQLACRGSARTSIGGLARDARRDVQLVSRRRSRGHRGRAQVARQRRAPRQQHQTGDDQQQPRHQHRRWPARRGPTRRRSAAATARRRAGGSPSC